MLKVLFKSYKSKLKNSITSSASKILYGTLSIKFPDGEIHSFEGKFPGPNANLEIKDWSVISNYTAKGSIGFGSDYINNLWESGNLPDILALITLNENAFGQYFFGNIFYKIIYQLLYFLKPNSILGSYRNVTYHYNLSNNFYRLWLDESMTYSSALFSGNENLSLEEAQQAKHNRILNKLNISPKESVLDIGCGWGACTEYLVEKGINVTGITLSEPQMQYAIDRIAKISTDGKAIIKLLDYRKLTGIFDYIISIGIFEHVGTRYWQTYFKKIAMHLKKGGKAMIQTIVVDESLANKASKNTSGFMQYYIFPGGSLPSHTDFINEANKAGLTCTESFAFGQDYAITLKHWLSRFDSQLLKIRKLGFSEKFIRCWRLYLSYARAGFLSNIINVVQFELQHR